MSSLAPGSSPLTRGKHNAHRSLSALGGLIPAHAGKTAPKSPTSRPARAHPHSRGENQTSSHIWLPKTGSSPLIRGKHRLRARVREHAGFIPAHAGKTWRSSCQWCWWGAHPRSRGENTLSFFSASSSLGSSPLTRGKRFPPRDRAYTDGLIPTHAGKTSA